MIHRVNRLTAQDPIGTLTHDGASGAFDPLKRDGGAPNEHEESLFHDRSGHPGGPITLHSLGSAPLEQTVMYTTSCYFSSVNQQTSELDRKAWLLDGDTVAFGWAGLAQGDSAGAALTEVTTFMLEDGLRARDAFERVKTRQAENGTKLKLRADENDDSRASRRLLR